MKINPLAVLLIGLAAVSLCGVGGLVGLGMLAAYFAAQMQPAALPMSTIPVVVAAVDLPAGTVLDAPDKQLVLRPHLPDTVPPGAFSDVEALRGKVIRRTLDRGVPIGSQDITAVQLEPGMRPVTLPLVLEHAFFGPILPGNRIDILAKVPNAADPNKPEYKTVASNVLVLAVDMEAKSDRKVLPFQITVALREDEAKAVAQAEKQGTLSFVYSQPAAVPEKLEPGMRALTIRRTGELVGALAPGCRVDVSVTLVDPDDPMRTWTKSVARDHHVLALNLRHGGDDGKVESVTLAVRQEDVAKFVEAREQGKINITVRPPPKPD